MERKSEGVTAAELRRTACAFANSVPEGRVGVIFIGLHDKSGEVTGVGNTDQLQKRVREAIQADCYPPIEYASEVLFVDDKTVLAIVISPSKTKPHFTGPAYARVGSESLKASPEQYEELILSRVDKVREIIKHKDGIFTVLGIGCVLGSNKSLHDAGYRERRNCKVETCTAHVVTLRDVDNNVRFSEPLEHVTVNYDHIRDSPMLMIRFPKG